MPRIDSNIAREYAQRSHEARRERRNSGFTASLIPQGEPHVAAGFAEANLTCTRDQITLLTKRLTAALKNLETPSMDIDRLVRSLASLREDERKLSGRSLPPVLKAVQSKEKRNKFSDLPQPD